MSRKGKGGTISKGRQRASTIKCGKGKDDVHQPAKKELGKIKKGRAVLASVKEAEPEELLEEKPVELEKNNNQLQAETNVEREAESGDEDDDEEEDDDDEDLGYHA